MPSLVDTNNRIKSIDSTMKITNAMKLIATAKLRSAKLNYEASLEYTKTVDDILNAISKCDGIEEYTIEKPAGKDLYIVIGSELGLCGGYNTNMFKYINDKDGLYVALGKKAISYFEYRTYYNVVFSKSSITDKPMYREMREMGTLIFNLYTSGEAKSINIIYTKYHNSVSFEPVCKKIFPLKLSDSRSVIDVEPDEEMLLATALPRYVDASILVALKESLVSEYASRRIAMESATDNANELINSLLVQRNRARQASITQEISEIVAGAEAL